MKAKAPYQSPPTISRQEFLIAGSDADFRRSIYTLVQSVGRLLACRDAFGRDLNLTPSQFAVLMGVAQCQGQKGVTIKDLADHVALASTHVTTEVGRLQRAGFLTKRVNTSDRRSVCVSLKPHGEREIARVTPFIRRVNDELFRDIDPASLASTYRVARQLIINSEKAFAEIRQHQGLSIKETNRHSNIPFAGTIISDVARHPDRPASRKPRQNGAVRSLRRGKAAGGPRSR